MYYRKHISEPRIKRCRRTIIVLLMLFAFLALNASIHPTVENMLTNQARIIFNDAVSHAVRNTAGESVTTDRFVTLTTGDAGVITSVQTNSSAVNEYRALLSAELADVMKNYGDAAAEIPIGSMTGLDIFAGRGPGVKFRLIQAGSITTDLISSFSEAGINQTCHTINCVINAEYYAVMAGVRIPVSLSTSVIIAQSIIVGEVPDSFTNVNGDQNDTIGRIFDYGDPYGEDLESAE